MSQNINLAVSGIYTSSNDMNGLPPGALNEAINVESRYKNVLGPRRGFEALSYSSIALTNLIRIVNFWVGGVDSTISLTDLGELKYFTSGLTPWVALPGDYSTQITPPNAINAKSRFIKAGQNLYVTAADGVRSISSGSAAQSLRAGVPPALNILAIASDDYEEEGFLDNNVVLDTFANIASGSPTVTQFEDTTGIAVGQYVTGMEVKATKVIQDITYTAVVFGALGNAVSVAYTTGGTAGSEVVSVLGNAISVKIQTGVSTATQVRAAVLATTSAAALVTPTITGTAGTAQTAPVAPGLLAGGIDNTIPVGTKVSSITSQTTLLIQTGTLTGGSVSVTALGLNTGIVAGVLVSGDGIPDGAKVVSISGAGPYAIVLNLPAYQSDTLVDLTFSSPLVVTLDANAVSTLTNTAVSFYTGSQVGYRIVYGRVETDINGSTISRIGAPSPIGIATNITPYLVNVEVQATLPKNSANSITFVRLYRSRQTSGSTLVPSDQYNLVYERQLVAADFTGRVITISDATSDSLRGLALYSGEDQEGILQSNYPPPMCWDMCAFRDFSLYVNVTQPSSLKFTVVSVGAPLGIQANDTLTISGSFLGVPFTQTYTAKTAEDAVNREFKVYSTGSSAQNISDTADSIIRVINYDNSLAIHAVLVSTTDDLGGQITLFADNPGYDTFTITASAHADAYDPTLTNVLSMVNTVGNGILVSKAGQLEAVPITNLLNAGDSSSVILRAIALRDYVIILKTDGIYKVQGLTPGGLTCSPFDLTTKIIGADTAVSLNSGVWMMSNQGVVSISDGGVDAKSIPVDDQLNRLIGSNLDALTASSFAIGYESDRKYVLSVSTVSDTVTDLQYIFNYVTSTWTNWNRRLRAAYLHSNDGKLYISRADSSVENGVSKERKSGTYRDFVDEATALEILEVVSPTVLRLSSITNVLEGDILFKDSTKFSPILSVDVLTDEVTVESDLSWTVGAIEVQHAFTCYVKWKQVFGDNPAKVRQFSEGLALFKNTRFNTAFFQFLTDYSNSSESVPVYGTGNGLWGLFSWGSVPWGGGLLPSSVRFYIPQNKQLGSYIIPSMTIRQGYSDFIFQGLSISYYDVSQEVGI